MLKKRQFHAILWSAERHGDSNDNKHGYEDGNKSSPGEQANLVELANTSTGSYNDSCYGGPLDGACGMGRESIEAYRNTLDS